MARRRRGAGATCTRTRDAKDRKAPESSASPPRSGRRVSWDLIRLLAVVCVVLYHGTTLAVHWHPELGTRAIRFPYQVGASMLLLISGYFAASSLHRGDPLRWWVGRVCRILPAYLVAVVFTALVLRLTAPAGWWAPSLSDIPVNWLMLWNWQPSRYAFVDPSYWTLPLQLMWFTALAWLFARVRPRGPGADPLLWGALSAQWFSYALHTYLVSESVRVWYEGLGVHRVHLFVAGLALYRWSRERMTHAHLAALLTACLVAHRVQTEHLSWTIGVGIGALVVALAARGPDWDRFVRGRAAVVVSRLAGIGYGVYLVHQAMGYRLMWWLARAGVGPLGQMCAMVTASLVAGWALTVLVERPAHTALMAWFDRARAPAAAGKAGTGSAAPPEGPDAGQAPGPPAPRRPPES